MSDSIQWRYHYLLMVRDIYFFQIFSQQSCMGNELKQQQRMSLFPPCDPFEFVAIDTFVRPTRIWTGIQFLVVTIDGYSKPTKATPTATIKSTQDAHTFFHDWALQEELPDIISWFNGQQLVSIFCKSLRIY